MYFVVELVDCDVLIVVIWIYSVVRLVWFNDGFEYLVLRLFVWFLVEDDVVIVIVKLIVFMFCDWCCEFFGGFVVN